MLILPTFIVSGAAATISLLGKKSITKKIKRKSFLKKLTRKSTTVKKKAKLSLVEAEARQQQYVSFSSLGIFGLGALFSPLITYAAFPLLAYNYFYMMKMMRDEYLQKGKLSVLLFDTLSITLTLVIGWFFLTGILFSVFFTAQRLVAKTEREAQDDFSRIFGELSNTVWLLKDDVELEVSLNSIKPQDIIVSRAGDMIPVDGKIISGEGMLDQHLLTGEAQLVEKKMGDLVLTSTLLVSGVLYIEVEKAGSDTITGQIAQTLEHAATFKHQVQSRGDEIVEKGAIRTMVACGVAFPFIGFTHAIALSYSGFGYQMRMAAPLMVLNYLRIASQQGILVKDGRALDKLQTVDTIVFDKTGTLTEEIPYIQHLIACEGFTEEQVLQYAASIEQRQKHPIAQAICQYAEQQNLALLELVNTDYAIGHGLRAEILDHTQADPLQTVFIGSRRFIDKQGIHVPSNIETMQQEAGDKGYSIVYVASESGQLLGAIELRPTIRPQAHEAVKTLHELGMTIYIISGDQEKPTRYLAEQLGIDHYFSETLPKDKARHIQNLQDQGHQVCFMGDGINDSVALQKSDVSISLKGAATIAQDTADIVLITPDLLHLPYLINMSKALNKRMTYSEILNNTAGISCVSGVLLFGMGLGGAILLFSGGILSSMTNAMLPLLKYNK